MSFNLYGSTQKRKTRQVVISESTAWVAPADCTLVIHAVGGGGGGACANNTVSARMATGGRGGGYAIKTVDAAGGDTLNIVIGAGGAGRNSSVPGGGTDGGDTTVSSSELGVSITAGGGGGGILYSLPADPPLAPSGGIALGGDKNYEGIQPFLLSSGYSTFTYSGGGGAVNWFRIPDLTVAIGSLTNSTGVYCDGTYIESGSFAAPIGLKFTTLGLLETERTQYISELSIPLNPVPNDNKSVGVGGAGYYNSSGAADANTLNSTYGGVPVLAGGGSARTNGNATAIGGNSTFGGGGGSAFRNGSGIATGGKGGDGFVLIEIWEEI